MTYISLFTNIVYFWGLSKVCKFSSGPRNVLTKLCLALSAFAVRTHSTDLWMRGGQRDVIGSLIDTFGQRGDPQSTVCLLEVLHVILAEAEDGRLEIENVKKKKKIYIILCFLFGSILFHSC